MAPNQVPPGSPHASELDSESRHQPAERGPAERQTQRDAILRRRMFFVSSALTVLTGCPPGGQAPNDAAGANSAVVVEPVSGPDGSRPDGSGPDGPAAPSTAQLPSLAVPTDVSEEAKAQFERLADRVPQIHAELDAAEKSVPDVCNIDDPSCDVAWTTLSTHLSKASDLELDLAADCFGSSADAKRFEASLAAHRQVIEARRKRIQAQIDQALSDEAKRARWEALQAKTAVPRPCLEFACHDW